MPALGRDWQNSWEVGVILGIAERTINFHIHNACKKLDVHGRQAAITIALQAGLLPVLTETPAPKPRRAEQHLRQERKAAAPL
ncbi:MAG: helix-turn-helix domain-containing protein [Burkholderiaceae bacterium]